MGEGGVRRGSNKPSCTGRGPAPWAASFACLEEDSSQRLPFSKATSKDTTKWVICYLHQISDLEGLGIKVQTGFECGFVVSSSPPSPILDALLICNLGQPAAHFGVQ
jgi:hypothetical protein